MNNNSSPKYSKEEIEQILRSTDFEYQRVDLPYGLHTAGQDRSATRDLIFPVRLDGQSILDVGCALGYFCFEAEVRGAERVVGVELKESRWNQAMILKDIIGSEAQFINGDIYELKFESPFDIVILLNVLHHVPEPMRLLRYLTDLVDDRLIIEFPTFDDPKFRKLHSLIFPWIFNRLPLIGVSSRQIKWVDQTFVYSPKAVERMLSDHTRDFSEVNIMASPMKGRKIAICKK